MCACVRAFVRACVRVRARACVCVCARVRVCLSVWESGIENYVAGSQINHTSFRRVILLTVLEGMARFRS